MSLKIGRNSPCWCGSGVKYKNCHAGFDEKLEQFKAQGHRVPHHGIIKNAEQIQKIRESAKINIAALDLVSEQIKEGISTADLDRIVHDLTIEMGGIPAPLGYQGFPRSICTSINNQVCHGIPSEQIILKNGDIINVDVSTNLNGHYSDSSRMFIIGDTSPENKRLVEIAKECVYKGLKRVSPWGFLGDMGQAVHDHAYANGFTIVREIGGHGIGLEFHEDPWVSYHSKKGQEMLLVPGMMFTIEPMVNMGKEDIFIDEMNKWTAYTKDGLPSAQWEIQVLVTEDGAEVITY
ncbi:MAG: methionyl aminopeptidase [Lachnospiraceae bacterium]